MTTTGHASAMWYLSRSSKCDHWKVSADGKRRTRCARWAKYGTTRCPAHSLAHRELTHQEACAVIAAFFSLVRL